MVPKQHQANTITEQNIMQGNIHITIKSPKKSYMLQPDNPIVMVPP